jgi:ABC-2 type transport system ATP-binding protein
VPIIETDHLRKEFDGLVAVEDLNLRIERGEVFGLLGPNGAGKTTTISMLVTLLKPTRGTARVNGCDIREEPAKVRRSLGIVFQDQTLDTLLTGRENMELHARLYGMPRGLRERRIAELLQLVDLGARADDQVKKYSGGMRRRLEIARGLLHRPVVLFLDEPTLGLDPQTRALTWEYIRRMVKEEGTTVVLTTHYMEEADLMCDRVGIIDHGKIVALDTPAKLKAGLGGDVVRLKAASADLERIRAVPAVTQAEVKDGWVEASVREVHRHLPAILAAIPGVESVEVHSPTLNDVFLKYTGRGIREEGAGADWMESAFKAAQGGH